MRIYETTFVINPQTDDSTIDKHVKDVQAIITSSNGKIIHESAMGTRRLAYEIKGLTQGYYASFLYEAESDVLSKLDRHFKINEAYIRDLTIRIEVDPEDVIKQIDPFGKHGSGRDNDDENNSSSRRGYSNDSSRDDDRKEEAKAKSPAVEKPAVKAAAVEETEDAPEESADSSDSPDDDKEL